MKKTKKKYINYPKERAVLSDIHPYEVPITFRNRYFYRFLVENCVEINSNNDISNRFKFTNDELNAFNLVNDILFSFNFNGNILRKIPFTFRISHKEKDFRELALIHPINQLKLVQFYDQFKELIIYSCSISNFSVRKPVNIAKFTFFNDKLHQQNKGDKNDFLDLYGKEYEDLKTFFSYEKYTNIYRFYEDYRYHRAEKKYNHLFKFDISKCFDSIYSHSISWAVLGLEAVKENIDASKNTFPGEFDKFIQYANYGETNGILIGPEFSRLFAEIILQRVDKNIELKLLEKKIKNKVDYELYRYVDDYFLFCDDLSLKEEIIQLFKHELKNYKLSINDAKSKDYSKPIITEITLAKEKITKLLSKNPRFIIEKKEEKEDNEEIINVLDHNFSFYFNADDLITQYKMIIKETNVEYKDVLNYSLALLSNIIEKNLINAQKTFLDNKEKVKTNEISDTINKNRITKVEDLLTSHLVNFIDFVFFIYSVSPRVNSTIKVCHILSKILLFYKRKVKIDNNNVFLIDKGNRQRINKKILDECSLIIKKNSINEYTQIETLYLFITIKELGKEFRLPNKIIENFLGLDKQGDIPSKKLNYFSITVLLYYFGHSQNELKPKLINYIKEYIQGFSFEIRSKSSELTHLILDLLACPFITTDEKREFYFIYKNFNEDEKTTNNPIFENLILFHKNHIKFWFTKWERFNFAKELDYKKSQEVYS